MLMNWLVEIKSPKQESPLALFVKKCLGSYFGYTLALVGTKKTMNSKMLLSCGGDVSRKYEVCSRMKQ